MSYIKVHREILESYSFSSSNSFKIWIWLLLKANYKKSFITLKAGRGETTIELNRGQLLFGRFRAEEELGIDGSLIYRIIKKFEELEQVIVESNNQYSIITICKYDDYQGEESANEQQMNSKRAANEQQTNSKRAANEQQMNTYKEELEEKEYKEEIINKSESFISNGTWEDEKRQFLISEQYQMGICTRHGLKKEQVQTYLKDFLSIIELNQDYRSCKGLKSYFTNWINKKVTASVPKKYNQEFDLTKEKIILKADNAQ